MKRLIAFLLFALSLSAQTKQLGPVKMAGASKRTFGAAGAGTWTHVADCTGTGALVCAFSVNPTQHDTVLIYLGSTPAPSPQPTCTDGASNSYTVSATHGVETGVGFTAYIAYILDAPSNANKTITCVSTGSGYTDTYGSEFRDTGGTPVLDAVYGSPDLSHSDPTTAAIALPTFTPAVAGSLAFCGVLPNSGISAPTGGGSLNGWTGAVNTNSASEYKLSASGASNASFTDSSTNDAYASVCIVVKP